MKKKAKTRRPHWIDPDFSDSDPEDNNMQAKVKSIVDFKLKTEADKINQLFDQMLSSTEIDHLLSMLKNNRSRETIYDLTETYLRAK